MPLELAWQSMRDGEVATIPILNDDGTLYGILSAGDVASYDLRTVYENHVDQLPLFNLISVLEGNLVNEFAETSNSISGKVQIAVPKSFSDGDVLSADSILICGDQPEVIKAALEAQVSCLIICQSEIAPELENSAGHTCIISTPLDARQAARLIYQAVPVMRLCHTEGIVTFHLSDYLDDVKETLLSSRYRCYPGSGRKRKSGGHPVPFPSAPAPAQAGCPGGPQRGGPVRLRPGPGGDTGDNRPPPPGGYPDPPAHLRAQRTCGQHQHHNHRHVSGARGHALPGHGRAHGPPPYCPTPSCSSPPTCTKRDKAMAERLARIANVSLKELGKELFSASGAEDRSAEELFMSDYKQFHIAEKDIGVSQITCIDSARLLDRRRNSWRL